MKSDSKNIQFKIVTPERIVFSENVKQVILPTAVGQITILPNHESLIGIIEPGEVCIKKTENGSESLLAISEGFVEVDNNVVKVFASTAQHAEELDEAAILKAKEEAEKALSARKHAADVSFADFETRLKRELIKLRILEKYRKKRKKI